MSEQFLDINPYRYIVGVDDLMVSSIDESLGDRSAGLWLVEDTKKRQVLHPRLGWFCVI